MDKISLKLRSIGNPGAITLLIELHLGVNFLLSAFRKFEVNCGYPGTYHMALGNELSLRLSGDSGLLFVEWVKNEDEDKLKLEFEWSADCQLIRFSIISIIPHLKCRLWRNSTWDLIIRSIVFSEITCQYKLRKYVLGKLISPLEQHWAAPSCLWFWEWRSDCVRISSWVFSRWKSIPDTFSKFQTEETHSKSGKKGLTGVSSLQSRVRKRYYFLGATAWNGDAVGRDSKIDPCGCEGAHRSIRLLRICYR